MLAYLMNCTSRMTILRITALHKWDKHKIAGHVLLLYSTISDSGTTWGVQVLRYPNFFFSGMEAHRNVKVVGGDVAVL